MPKRVLCSFVAVLSVGGLSAACRRESRTSVTDAGGDGGVVAAQSPAPERPPLTFEQGPFLAQAGDGKTELLVFVASCQDVMTCDMDSSTRYLAVYDSKTLTQRYVKIIEITSPVPATIVGVVGEHIVIYAGYWDYYSFRASDGARIGSARTPEVPTGDECVRPDGILINYGDRLAPGNPVLFDPRKLTMTQAAEKLPVGCLPKCIADIDAKLCVPHRLYDAHGLPAHTTEADKALLWQTKHEYWVRSGDVTFSVGTKYGPTRFPFAMRMNEWSMKVQWKADLPGHYALGGMFYEPPDLIGQLFVVPYFRDGGRVVGLSAETGAIVWEHRAECGTLRVLGERVFETCKRAPSPVFDARAGTKIGTIKQPVRLN